MASKSWNKVELLGNLVRDAELKETPSGAKYCTFTIATNRSFKAGGELKEEAEFTRCIAWEKLAELCAMWLKKGKRAFVAGRLQTNKIQETSITEVVVEDMIVLDKEPQNAQTE